MNQNEALVKSAIHDAVIRAVTEISADVKGLLKDALARETNETAQSMLRSMVDNLSIAKEGDKAVCQSPGYPTTWLSFGDGNLPECTREAISEAVAEATKKGYLRPSMVDPLTRENSGNNTGKGVPNIEYEYHPGQKYVDFIISFKGCGAELGNAMQIMTTAKLGKNLSGLKRFILETAVNAGGKPGPACDCLVPGIGEIIGGSQREERLERLEGRIQELGMRPEDYWWYLDLRRYGGCKHAGFGLGFERMVMYLTGISNIRDVLPHPRTVGNAEF